MPSCRTPSVVFCIFAVAALSCARGERRNVTRRQISACSLSTVTSTSGQVVWSTGEAADRVPEMPVSVDVFDDLSLTVRLGGHLRMIDESSTMNSRCFFCGTSSPIAVDSVSFDNLDTMDRLRISIVQHRCRSFTREKGCIVEHAAEKLAGLYGCAPVQ